MKLKFVFSKGHRPESSVVNPVILRIYRGIAAQELSLLRLCRDKK
jgi:hypothetical protein